MNFYNTLLVISTVDCCEFNQVIRAEKIGLVICSEFIQHTLSNCNGELQ